MAAVVCCAAVLPAASAAQSDTAGVGAVLRQLVVESLAGGGVRPDQLLFADDSASAALLRLAGISAATGTRPSSLLCPGSTNADASPVQPPVGYLVKVVLTAGTDSTARRIDVSKRCFFRYRGGGRGFGEGGVWELRLRDGRWYLGRRLEGWIT